MDFDSGIRIVQDTDDPPNPDATWTGLLSGHPGLSRIGITRNHSSFEEDPSNETMGTVEFVERGVLVIVRGNGELPVRELKEVAESLEP
jgi:hypothetical protein